MKILISAYACEPNRGSEPGVGWHTVWELAKNLEVWVLTRPDDVTILIPISILSILPFLYWVVFGNGVQ